MNENECEFKAECEEAEMNYHGLNPEPCRGQYPKPELCRQRKFVLLVLNSPQFKKKYALQDNCETLAELREQVGWERGYGQGQQNPDPKQYANREELEKAFQKVSDERNTGIIPITTAQEIVRTHGLEE